jgi:hypothetical protein
VRINNCKRIDPYTEQHSIPYANKTSETSFQPKTLH